MCLRSARRGLLAATTFGVAAILWEREGIVSWQQHEKERIEREREREREREPSHSRPSKRRIFESWESRGHPSPS